MKKTFGKKVCTLIVKEDCLVAMIKILTAHKLSKNLTFNVDESEDGWVIEFKSNYKTWDTAKKAIVESKMKVFTRIADQFGKIHSIELA